MPFLLDTNVWIHYLKNPGGPIHAHLARRNPAEIVTCSIVRSELLHGAHKYAKAQQRVETVVRMLAPFHSLPFDDATAVIYAGVRHELETAGLVIGPYDLQIAAICLLHAHTLVTSNVNEFSRVPGLRVEDWLNPASAV